MPRKVHVLNIVGESVGGIRRHVHTILAGLPEAQFEISYAHSSLSTDSVFGEDLRVLRPRLKCILPLPIGKRPGLNDIANLWTLLRYVRKHGVAVVHGHGAKGGAYARLLRVFSNVATIYTPHGGVLHDAFSPVERFVYLAVERQLRPFTNRLVFESNYSKNSYLTKIGMAACPAVLNYNGVSPEAVRHTGLIPRQLREERRCGFHIGLFARLCPMKGQDLAIEVVERLRAVSKPELPDATVYLHLFGAGPDEFLLRSMVAERVLGESVFFHGEISNTEEVMSCLDAVLIPSRFESFSYVAAEALMVGVPVIAANVGGLQEVLGGACGLLVDGTPAAYAEAIKSLMQTPGLKQRLVERGRLRYQTCFREDRMITTLTNLYQELARSIRRVGG